MMYRWTAAAGLIAAAGCAPPGADVNVDRAAVPTVALPDAAGVSVVGARVGPSVAEGFVLVSGTLRNPAGEAKDVRFHAVVLGDGGNPVACQMGSATVPADGTAELECLVDMGPIADLADDVRVDVFEAVPAG